MSEANMKKPEKYLGAFNMPQMYDADEMDKYCAHLEQAVKHCFPRTTHGIDHGCYKCVGITGISDGVFMCPYHMAEQVYAGLQKYGQKQEGE